MHFSHVLATSLGVVSASTYYGHYEVSLGDSTSKDISGIQKWKDVTAEASQDFCSDNQNFTVTATDADGEGIQSTAGVNAVHLSIPANSTYPVTVEASGDAGTISTVLTNDKLPTASTQTFQYLLEFDFCPDNDLELKRSENRCTDKEFDDGWCIPKKRSENRCTDKEFDDGWCIPKKRSENRCTDKEFEDGWCIPKAKKRDDGCSEEDYEDGVCCDDADFEAGWCIP